MGYLQIYFMDFEISYDDIKITPPPRPQGGAKQIANIAHGVGM